MKILLVTSYLDDGGAEKWMLDTVRNMDLTGVKVDYYFWFSAKNTRFVSYYQKSGVNLFIRNLDHKKGNLFWLKSDFEKFLRERGSYDAVHINGTGLYGQMIILTVAQRFNIPVRIVHSHNSIPNEFYGIKRIIRNYLRKQVIKKSTIVGGCSELATVTKYGQEIVNNSKYCIFKNGIDLYKYSKVQEMRSSQRKKLMLEDKIVFLHIGRFEKQKNHDFLIDIFSEVSKLREDAVLLLVGHGSLEKDVFNKIDKLNLSTNVIHVSYTETTEVYYSVADVFLFPSLFEGLPFVLLEVQACGLPCVISDVISQETKVNNNVVSLPLGYSALQWAEYGISMIGKRCLEGHNNLIRAGYDLKQTARDFLECCKGANR